MAIFRAKISKSNLDNRLFISSSPFVGFRPSLSIVYYTEYQMQRVTDTNYKTILRHRYLHNKKNKGGIIRLYILQHFPPLFVVVIVFNRRTSGITFRKIIKRSESIIVIVDGTISLVIYLPVIVTHSEAVF